MASGKRSDPLIVVVGKTASGKSALALDLAEQFDGEIICADSWTVRREVNIGTAKPSMADQVRIPHHMIDIVDPCADFTAAVFKRLASKAIRDIQRRGKMPIMVGGTGLYVDSVLFDFGFLPTAPARVRSELNGLSVPELLARIQQRGLEVGDVDIRNKRRLIRVLETNGAHPSKSPLRPNTLVIGIQLPREKLLDSVTARIDNMIQNGLEEEVVQLANKYGWECEALKGIGYREWHAYFQGTATLAETTEKIIKATLGLAKRQQTWFKKNNSIHWVNNRDEAVAAVTTFLNK